MSILSNNEIIKEVNINNIKIHNFTKEKVKNNSYEITLSNKIQVYALSDNVAQIGQTTKDSSFETYGMISIENPNDSDNCGYIRCIPYIDSISKNTMIEQKISEDGYILLPRILYLIDTEEYIETHEYNMEIRTSMATFGLKINNSTYVQSAYNNKHLKLAVEVIHPLKIYPGMKVGNVYFHTLKDTTRGCVIKNNQLLTSLT